MIRVAQGDAKSIQRTSATTMDRAYMAARIDHKEGKMTDSDVRNSRTSEEEMANLSVRVERLAREKGELKAEVERLKREKDELHDQRFAEARKADNLLARESKWRELVELLYVDGHGFEIPNTEKHNRMRKLRSELVEQGGEE